MSDSLEQAKMVAELQRLFNEWGEGSREKKALVEFIAGLLQLGLPANGIEGVDAFVESLSEAELRKRLKAALRGGKRLIMPALEFIRVAATRPAAQRKVNGKKGGAAAAAVTHQVRDYAVRLAKEREPEGGWQSAPGAREAIMADVRDFARQCGGGKSRSYSARKVEKWLREAGIKRG